MLDSIARRTERTIRRGREALREVSEDEQLRSSRTMYLIHNGEPPD